MRENPKGGILVVKAIVPALIPQISSSEGVVCQIGGYLTHVGIISREFGIPAVASVDKVINKIRTGQKIKINGTNGEVIIYD